MSSDRIDWSQIWYPGPAREFSADELARAGGDRPSRSVLVALAVNLAGCIAAGLAQVPWPALPWVVALLLAAAVPAWRGAMWLWAGPSRRRLMNASLVALGVQVATLLALREALPDRSLGTTLAVASGLMTLAITLGYWLLVQFRAHQIEARLRELDERAHAVAMARQLATAQIQPHFLFNSLASLQHWVDAGDTRAGPMLASLTGYLRAVLPLFRCEQLALGDELGAVQRYLEVVRARLGERLRFGIEADAAARAVPMPPGLLLTLVENAVEHGVQPSLRGAEVRIQARIVAQADDRVLTLEVSDTGPGLPDPLAEGLGLANTRQRLAQAYGSRAALALGPGPDGGTVARLELPLPT